MTDLNTSEIPVGAIRIRGVSKRYRLATGGPGYTTLREAIMGLGRRSNGERAGDQWFWAVQDVTLDVEPGEVVGLIGRNGAGKTTLLKILSRITAPTAGKVAIRGRVGSLLEVGTGFHPELSGRENIYLSGAVLGMRRAEIERKFDQIVSFAEVERFIDTPVKRFSTGMYLRLAFAVAGELEPEVLLVDEVLAVGDAAFRRKALGRMRDIARGGRTVVLVSHDMSSIRQLCHRAVWLDRGAIVADGDANRVTLDYERAVVPEERRQTARRRDRSETTGRPVWLDSVAVSDVSGRPRSDFIYGETLRLGIELGGRPPRDDFTIEWLFFDERGNRVSFGTANPQCDVYLSRDTRQVQVDIGPLWLTSGLYRVWLSVRVWNQPPRWDEWEEAAWFQVTLCDVFGTGFDATSLSAGPLAMQQRWTVTRRGTGMRGDDSA